MTLAAAPVVTQCPNGPVFAPPLDSSAPPGPIFQIVHGDFDRDGDEDFAFMSQGELHVRRNDGAAGFASPLVLATSTGITALAVGDFDRDGWLDFAAVAGVSVGGSPIQTETRLQVWRNGGPTAGFVGFTATTSVLSSGPGYTMQSVVAAQLDADGVVDLAVYDGRGTFWVLRGAGAHGVPSGTFLAPVGYPIVGPAAGNLVAADFNADSAVDLALITYSGQYQMTVLEGQRSVQGQPLGTFGPLHSTPMPSTPPITSPVPGSMSAHDFDADGLPDLLFADGIGSRLVRNLGGFAFATPLSFTVGVGGLYFGRPFAGDFDRNGKVDIAVPTETHYAQPPYNFHVLSDPLGAAIWSSRSVGPGLPVCGASLDVDNDGLLDVAIGKNYHSLSTASSTCSVLPAPTISIVFPNGGEFLLAGQPSAIQWTASTAVAEFDVDVSFDDGVTWSPIARNIVGNSCPWWVPEPSSNRARVRVMPSNVPVSADVSDGPVTIGGPGLASAVPLGNGCGQPLVPSANATVPHLGGATTLAMTGASANAPAAWWVSVPVVPPLPLPGGINCFVWLDPAAMSLLAFGSTDANGRYEVSASVPANTGLIGLALAAQATAFVPASALGLQLSNGIGLVLGF